uniref:ARAD1D16060p n=1 Tax=Blastobotrys adeninivorans TaxID=409370 RepID=A0A060T956_BLAAD
MSLTQFVYSQTCVLAASVALNIKWDATHESKKYMSEFDDNLPLYDEVDVLPAYGWDCKVVNLGQMGIHKDKVTVIMSGNNNYQPNRSIKGQLVVQTDCSFNCVAVDLVLIESVARSKEFVDTRAVRRCVLSSYKTKGEMLNGTNHLKEGEGLSFTFSLFIPNQVPETACKGAPEVQAVHLQLPPTVGAKLDAPFDTDYRDLPDSCLRIGYVVRARLYNGNSEVLHTIRQIPLIPRYNTIRQLSHANKEVMTTCKIRAGKFTRRYLGTASVRVVPPPPINASTQDQLSLQPRITYTPGHAGAPPPELKGIEYRIVMYTLTSVSPSASEVHGPGRGVQTSTEVLAEHSITPGYLAWEIEPLEDDIVAYSTTINLVALLPHTHPHFTPTFSTCLATRKYELRVAIDIAGTSLRTTIPLHFS